MECTSGILSNKFHILHKQIIYVKVNFTVDIVKNCCVLHNIVCDGDVLNFNDTLAINGFEKIDVFDNSGTN